MKLVGLIVGAIALIVLKPALAAGIFLFGVVVGLHEAGHLICAKKAGMRVDAFSIGMGPALWSFQRGETEYRIAPIPFGGYVHIVGLDPEEEGAAEDPRGCAAGRDPQQRGSRGDGRIAAATGRQRRRQRTAVKV